MTEYNGLPASPILNGCFREWRSPRPDTKHETVPVNHLCTKDRGHEGDHVCVCGAIRQVINL